MKTIYQELSEERKVLQEKGLVPEWFSTSSWQLFSSKYTTKTEKDFKSVAKRISKCAAKWTDNPEVWENKFFNVIWNGWLSCATPVLANMGTDRGCPVSCSGNFVSDSVYDFYETQKEVAVLSKNGFGTSSYLGSIRPRGTEIKSGGKASGVLPVLKDFVQLSRDISQGNCYHPSVEVLTEFGFMSFAEALARNVRVVQVSEDNKAGFVTPIEWVEQDYSGDLIRFYDAKNIDIMVTPNHRMYFKRELKINGKRTVVDKFTTQSADDCPIHRDVVFSNSVNIGGDGSLTDYERFLIAHQADGHRILSKSSTPKDIAVNFHFSKSRKIDRLTKIIDDIGLEYTKTIQKDGSTNFYVKISEPRKTFSWVELDKMSYSKAREFLVEVSNWDGTKIKYDKKGRMSFSYSSTDIVNISVLQSIAALAGFKSRSTKLIRENKSDLYNIHFSEGQYFGCEKVNKETVHYNGKVYCAVVPYGGLVVRSNGHTLVCGNTRRGAWAGYLEIDHDDFWEVINFLNTNPDDCNIGWIISDAFIKRLNSGDKKALDRYQKAMKTKMVSGKGYFFFVDKTNKLNPKTYRDQGLKVKASNLCSEITLYSDKNHTYTCVLSSLNLAKYDEWKDTDAVFVATVFLDCVASEFISIGKDIKGLENAVRFTEKGRALGLGVMGFHTYLQMNMIPFESMDAHFKNIEIFKKIKTEAENATKWMSETFGEPEWCRGYNRRNTHLIAVAPTLSTAGIMGGVSQGIEPVYKNVYVQGSAAGEMNRINPVFLQLLKEKGIYDDAHIDEVINNNGSVQNVGWLNDEEKKVFKTAFEIDQKVIVRLASVRQQFVDQAQSINLFFSADESEEYISEVHQMAFNDPMIKSLYYIRSESGVQASKGECESCAG